MALRTRPTCMRAFNTALAPPCRSFATGAPDNKPSTSSQPQQQQQQQQPRAIDARSLAARGTDGKVKILRAPNLRLRTAQTGQNRRTPGQGFGIARRSAKGSGSSSSSSNNNNNKKRDAKKPRDRNRRQTGEEAGEDMRAAEIQEILNEKKAQEKQVPVRYAPVQYDCSKLQETWPALPIGTTAQATTVLEKLNFLSRRFANGYVPPHELARRLFEGEHVIFRNEEEKKAAIEEFDKLARQRADTLTQRKGEVIEPEPAGFTPTSKEDRDAFVGQLVQGKYSIKSKHTNPVLNEVERQLFNNETYRIAGKQSGFMAKLETLMASAQPKRASK